jgi:hypothetical protein
VYGPSQIVALPSTVSPAGITYPLPGGELTEIESLCFKLVTSAAVANRQVIARLQDALGIDTFAVAAPAVQTATTTVVYSFAPLVPVFGTLALGFMGGPFPRAFSGDNLTLVVSVVNAGAGDVIEDGRLTVKQYPRIPEFFEEQ